MANKPKVIMVRIAGQTEKRVMTIADLPIIGRPVRLGGTQPFQGLFCVKKSGQTTAVLLGNNTPLTLYDLEPLAELPEGESALMGEQATRRSLFHALRK